MFPLAVAATLAHKVLWNSPWPSYCNQSVVDPQPDFSKFGLPEQRAQLHGRRPSAVGVRADAGDPMSAS